MKYGNIHRRYSCDNNVKVISVRELFVKNLTQIVETLFDLVRIAW